MFLMTELPGILPLPLLETLHIATEVLEQVSLMQCTG